MYPPESKSPERPLPVVTPPEPPRIRYVSLRDGSLLTNQEGWFEFWATGRHPIQQVYI